MICAGRLCHPIAAIRQPVHARSRQVPFSHHNLIIKCVITGHTAKCSNSAGVATSLHGVGVAMAYDGRVALGVPVAAPNYLPQYVDPNAVPYEQVQSSLQLSASCLATCNS